MELRIFVVLWNDLCRDFDPLMDVTFVLQKKPVLLKSYENESRDVFTIFKSPTDRQIACQAQEVSKRGTCLPVQYAEWSVLFPEKKIEQKYLEKQWDATVKVLFVITILGIARYSYTDILKCLRKNQISGIYPTPSFGFIWDFRGVKVDPSIRNWPLALSWYLIFPKS